MKKTYLLVLFTQLLLPCLIGAQETFRVMSYNVENFFDIHDNPHTEDQDFTPSGIRHWTAGRYHKKLQQTAKVILAAGAWELPALVALCEVENPTVVGDLLRLTPLRNSFYQYCMTEGNDIRGINSALLYRRDLFRLINHTNIRITAEKRQRPTRQVLYACGELTTGDTLDVFVVHLPSRYSGQKETEPYRCRIARMIRRQADSIQQTRQRPQILIMGDFNDTPADPSLTRSLAARPLPGNKTDSVLPDAYYNLCYQEKGSHKFQGNWNQLDHILINGKLLNPAAPFYFNQGSQRVFAPKFLLKNDRTWHGTRPYRTWHGYRYEGGFSDHLPVIADFGYGNVRSTEKNVKSTGGNVRHF